MNQYPKEPFEDDEAENVSPFIREYMRRLNDGSWPKMTMVIATPTSIGHLKSMYELMHREKAPFVIATPSPDTEWIHDERLGVRRFWEFDSIKNPTEASIVRETDPEQVHKMPQLDFSEIEKRIAAAFHVPNEFLKMGLGKSYGHMAPEYYPKLIEAARIREENIARIQNKLTELSELYGKDMAEKVQEAAEKLNRTVEECIDLFKQFKSVSIAQEKLGHYENVRKLIAQVRFQVGETDKKKTHATRDRIPVPKKYKRNRHSR